MTTDDRLARQVAIRLSDDDMDRLDALAESIPIASRNAIARAALRIGLAALEARPRPGTTRPRRATSRNGFPSRSSRSPVLRGVERGRPRCGPRDRDVPRGSPGAAPSTRERRAGGSRRRSRSRRDSPPDSGRRSGRSPRRRSGSRSRLRRRPRANATLGTCPASVASGTFSRSASTRATEGSGVQDLGLRSLRAPRSSRTQPPPRHFPANAAVSRSDFYESWRSLTASHPCARHSRTRWPPGSLLGASISGRIHLHRRPGADANRDRRT